MDFEPFPKIPRLRRDCTLHKVLLEGDELPKGLRDAS
jgi:hypothetical protein